MPDLSYINEQLRPLAVPIETLNPDPANERIHDEKNMEAIKGSIKRFGQHQVVTVWLEKDIIVVGNGRWKAMKEMGYTHIAANVRSFTEVEAAALRVADNRTSELGRWDKDALEETINALKGSEYPIDDLGFPDDDIKALLGTTFLDYAPTPDDPTKEKGEGEGYKEKVVVSVSDLTVRSPLQEAIKKLIVENGWTGKAEVV